MPSNINFGPPFDPVAAVQRGQDYANRMYQYAAKQRAGGLYASGDYAGAAGELASIGDFETAGKISDRGTLLSAGEKYAAGDYAGAGGILAKGGRLGDAETLATKQIETVQKQQEVMGNIGSFLDDVSKDPTANPAQAWQLAAQNLQAAGIKPEQIAQFGQQYAANPKQLAAFLKKLAKQEFVYQSEGGVTRQFDKESGNLVATYGTPTTQPGAIELVIDDANNRILRFNKVEGTVSQISLPGTASGNVAAPAARPALSAAPPPQAQATPQAPVSLDSMIQYLQANEGGTDEQWAEWAKDPENLKKIYDKSVEMHGGGGAQPQTVATPVAAPVQAPATPASQMAAPSQPPPMQLRRLGTAPTRTAAGTEKERLRNYLLDPKNDPASEAYMANYAAYAAPRPYLDTSTGETTLLKPDVSMFRVPTFGGHGTAPQAPRGAATGQPTVTVQKVTPGKLTNEEALASGFARRMASAGAIINANQSAGTSLYNRSAQGIPLAGNYIVSSAYQQLDQAERDFVNAQLRRESGAAIRDEEFANATRQYFPRPGDSPAVLEQKRRARELAIQNMQGLGTPGGRGMMTPPPSDTAGSGSGRIVDFKDLPP